MEITFLGTGGMAPTRERNTAGILTRVESEGVLFDCGEGIQRQMKIAGISLTKVTHILISHWHGDHVFGLPGLLQSLAASEYPGTLKIYGPDGTEEKFKRMVSLFGLSRDLKIRVRDVGSGDFEENRFFTLSAEPLDHEVSCLGFRLRTPEKRRINLDYTEKIGLKPGPLMGRLQRNQSVEFEGKTVTPQQATHIVPGKVIAYVTDTSYCPGALKLAEDADLLMCEATFSEELEEKANQYKHLTAKQAATIAKQSNVKELILTHFSQRFPDVGPLEESAKKIFPNSSCASDFLSKSI